MVSMKYSLRSLMVVLTLACVVLGGRIEYLRRWAVFHEREALRFAEAIWQDQGLSNAQIDSLVDPAGPFHSRVGSHVTLEESSGDVYVARIDENFRSYDRHRKLADRYRAAGYRIWISVPEPVPLP